ncbi:competence protein ComEA [Burkholderia latens]|uniref:ComEA family DNA-binding protein n=1 Tax=Burkholderia latens TaxID=488446 RepID=UPI0039A584F8
MLKKLLMLFVALSLSVAAGLAAAVEVNTADQAALESVKGLGPVKSKAIIDERTKNGPFKDADDLANRVKGLGTKSVGHLEENGLTIGGSSTPPKGVKLSKPATASAGTTAPSASTTATAGTTATAPAPTASAPEAASKPAKSKRASKKEKAAATAAASADAGASAPAAASSAKATKGSKKKNKKDKAASAAAASGA